MRVTRSIGPRVLAAILAIGVAGCAGDTGGDARGETDGDEGGTRPPVGVIGGAFPDYAAPTLGGDAVALSDLRGEVVLLNVWATWCPPCRREMPSLQALHDELAAEGLRVVGVSIDAPGSEEEIRSFLDELGITYTILHDQENRIDDVMGIFGIPHTFLIGRDGTFLDQWLGEIDAVSEQIKGPVREALDALEPGGTHQPVDGNERTQP